MERAVSREALRQSLAALGRRAAQQQDERLGREVSDQARVSFRRHLAWRAGLATTTAMWRGDEGDER
jgi:hypothetical protein